MMRTELLDRRAPGGLRVIAREAFAKGLVALNLYVDGGNRTETAELSGLSHYYEHLIFRGGTRKQAELETRKAFDSLGDLSGWTSQDCTCYHFVVPADRFDAALERFADAVLDVQVTEEKVAREREVILSEYKMSRADSPAGWAWWNLMRTAFRRHPYGRTTLGRREVIEGADLPRFHTFHAERYVPNHMTVSVVGAIERERAFEKVAAAFSSRAPGRESFETGEDEPAPDGLRVIVEGRVAEKSYADVAFRAPAAAAPDAAAVTVLAQLLGGGESSRLEREVRARRAEALSISAWFVESVDPGIAGFSFSADPGKELAALASATGEVARLRSEEVPADELARARTKMASDYLFGGESYQQQANRLNWFATIEDPALGADYIDRLRAVTAADIQAAARRWLDPRAATISIVQPASRSFVADRDVAAAFEGAFA